MKNEVVFYAADDTALTIEPPKPSAESLPRYFRAIEAPSRGNPHFGEDGYISNVRACVPFADALSAGWIQSTWCDIFIRANGAEIRYDSSNDRSPIIAHRDIHPQLAEAWADYIPVEFMWLTQWQPQTPKGYSLLITQPMNRLDLPFHTVSGIIDADKFTVEGSGRIPFYLRRGFTGLIPSGTPMYQIIPIKREVWKRELREHNDKRRPRTYSLLRRYFTGGYRREYWQRKEYR